MLAGARLRSSLACVEAGSWMLVTNSAAFVSLNNGPAFRPFTSSRRTFKTLTTRPDSFALPQEKYNRRLSSTDGSPDPRVEALRSDPESRVVLDFLLNLPRSEFVFYGQIIRDIYESKVLKDGAAVKQHLERSSIKETNRLKVELNNRENQLEELRVSRARLEAETSQQLVTRSQELTRLQAELRAEQDHRETTVAKAVEAGKSRIQDELGRRHEVVIKDLQKRNEKLQEEKDAIWNRLREGEEENKAILTTLKEIKCQTTPQTKPEGSKNIGLVGEDFVLSGLRAAFPQNERIYKTEKTNCGDIIFQIENTGLNIMFEVKDVKKPISSHRDEVAKFHTDARSKKLGFAFDAAVLVSLNSVVDPAVKDMEPFVRDGVTCLYVDNGHQNLADPLAFRAVVALIKATVNMRQETRPSANLKEYMDDVKKMLSLYQKMSKNNKATQGHLEDLKEQLDGSLKKLQLANKQ